MNEKCEPEKEYENVPDIRMQERIGVESLSQEKYNSQQNGCDQGT
ncbi:hypothetical protein [Dyadobacter jiangsuensis]|nr:hypothetical protein [Dyadobacter jiangsuensis]